MKIVNLGSKNSIINNYMAELRDSVIQKDSMRFRTNLERLGALFAYEVSKVLQYSTKEVETPLGISPCNTLDDEIVIASIMRAGLPIHNGILSIFDRSQSAFVAAYRKYGNDNRFTIEVEYASAPSLEDKVLILADSMLATGSSLELTYKRLSTPSEPIHTHIISPIASSEGVEYLSKRLSHKRTTLWIAAIDEELTRKSYIVPGLGDAGDLAYGAK